jgi:hypothetical protein
MDTGGTTHIMVEEYLLDRNLNPKIAEANGWYPSQHAGDSHLRIVIPAVSAKPGHVYWQARAIIPADNQIRYQSPRGPRHGAIVRVEADPFESDCSEFCVVVEGPMDALAAADCGYDSFALMGINPGIEAMQHLVKLLKGRPTLIALDAEPEATSQSIYLASWLCTQGILAKFSTFREANDLAAGTKKQRQAFIESALWWKP